MKLESTLETRAKEVAHLEGLRIIGKANIELLAELEKKATDLKRMAEEIAANAARETSSRIAKAPRPLDGGQLPSNPQPPSTPPPVWGESSSKKGRRIY